MKTGLVFYDVDTQADFMNKNGALYVPDAELIKPNLGLLTDFAREEEIVVVGSVDRHFGTDEYRKREGELQRFGGPFPDHCMNDTKGQLKIFETILQYVPKKVADLDKNGKDFGIYLNHALNNTEDNLMQRALEEINAVKEKKKAPFGVYFEKQNYDVFTNPRAAELLLKANVREAVVYGVATDYCVKAAVLGMQKLGIQTYVVQDAIKGITPDGEKLALEQMALAGAKLTTTNRVLEKRIWQ